MEPLEGGRLRPRQVRYQAALRPDLKIPDHTAISRGAPARVLAFQGRQHIELYVRGSDLDCSLSRHPSGIRIRNEDPRDVADFTDSASPAR